MPFLLCQKSILDTSIHRQDCPSLAALTFTNIDTGVLEASHFDVPLSNPSVDDDIKLEYSGLWI
jgi:hypothetical protein